MACWMRRISILLAAAAASDRAPCAKRRDAPLDCPRAAIKPRGFLALALLAVGAVGMVAFQRWAAGQVKRQASGTAAML